jgi:hypothetical protein
VIVEAEEVPTADEDVIEATPHVITTEVTVVENGAEEIVVTTEDADVPAAQIQLKSSLNNIALAI